MGFVVEGFDVFVFELDFFDLFFLEEDEDDDEAKNQPMMIFEVEGEASKDVYIAGGKRRRSHTR